MKKGLFSRHELPVLMYHRLVAERSGVDRFNLQVAREEFERQLLWLKRWGFTPVTFEELLQKPLPRKPVLLTFDDGYEDNYLHLFPLLQKYQVKAVVYALGDRSMRRNEWDIPQGEPVLNLLSDAQVLEMSQSGWVEFGAHSMTHQKLTESAPDERRRQIFDAKKSLESLLGKSVVSFAYPYGYVNEEVKKEVHEAGYAFGVAVNSGPTAFFEDPFEIRRIHVFPRTGAWDYWRKTAGFYLRYRKIFRS